MLGYYRVPKATQGYSRLLKATQGYSKLLKTQGYSRDEASKALIECLLTILSDLKVNRVLGFEGERG